ncbi:MAG: para-aminobenzoate synthase [Nitrospinaceae bacterium]|nr:MAG: para-aminobenzoate synthase [Nitrospinaceae bacterium]
MHIEPSRTEYSELIRNSKRVPVCGQKCVPNLSPSLLYRELFKDRDDSFLLESGKGPEATARYSLLGASNGRSIKIQGEEARLQDRGLSLDSQRDPMEVLDDLNFDDEIQQADHLPHFWGGWVGVIGYELAGLFENLPTRKSGEREIPDLYMVQVDRLLVYDHKKETLKVIVSRESGGGLKDYDAMVNDIQTSWTRIENVLDHMEATPEQVNEQAMTFHGNNANALNGLQSDMTRGEYLESVEKAKKYIEEGDIYQANLSQRFATAYKGDPFDLFLHLRSLNPSPFSGFLKFKDFSIVSSSPERLVKVNNFNVETRPIAGTRPRSDDPVKDQSLSTELLLNEKERAEHLMLVDLERNDLGRICKTGSVHVSDLMFLEQYSHVSHIVSNIRGELLPQVSVKDILRAVFPGGTITGCPKVRCMEIINELEPRSRGLYCGSFGYIGFSRTLDLNIIIRSIVLKNGQACFHVGAGIVSDSSPEREYVETLDKAAAMVQVLSGRINGGR